MRYAEFEHSVAIVSDDLTLVLPETHKYPLRFLQLPLMDGLVCQFIDSPDNEVLIHYRRATGHQISQSVKRATEDVQLLLGDQAQSIAFAHFCTEPCSKETGRRISTLVHERPISEI